MKFTYLILLAIAIIACLASVTEAGKTKEEKRLARKERKNKRGRGFNALKKDRKKKRRNGNKKKDDSVEEDEEDKKKKRTKKNKGGKNFNKKGKKKGAKKDKKKNQGSRKFKKTKKNKNKKNEKSRPFRKGGKVDFGKDEKKNKAPKMCKRLEIKELPGKVVVEYIAMFPDGFYEVTKASADFGFTGGCEAQYCVGKIWEFTQYTCTHCLEGNPPITYDVGQCLPLSDYAKKQCMVNPADPKAPGVWKSIGARDFPMSLTQIMKYSGNLDACFGK